MTTYVCLQHVRPLGSSMVRGQRSYLEVDSLCEPFTTFDIWADLLSVSPQNHVNKREAREVSYERSFAGMGSPVSIEVILLQELLGASWNITQESLEVLLDATLLCPRLGGMVRINGPQAAEFPTLVRLTDFSPPHVLLSACPASALSTSNLAWNIPTSSSTGVLDSWTGAPWTRTLGIMFLVGVRGSEVGDPGVDRSDSLLMDGLRHLSSDGRLSQDLWTPWLIPCVRGMARSCWRSRYGSGLK